MTVLSRVFVILAVSTLATGLLSPAVAQRCLRIESDPGTATLTVRAETSVSKGAPASFCSLQPGFTYMLTISRGGYEKRTLSFHFSDFGQPTKFSGVWRWMVFRSAVLPGWGQVSMGHRGRTAELWSFLVIDGFKVYQVWKWYKAEKNRFDTLTVLATIAETQQQLEELERKARKASMDANAYRTSVLLTVGVGAWLYVRNVAETYLLSAPPKATRLDGSDFKVVTPKRSRKRALFRSVFFPGLGQRYAGNGGRGFLFHTGVFVLGLYTIDAKLRYDLATVDYDLAVEEFNNAESVAEKESLRWNVLSLAVQKEERKDQLTAFAVATGLLWVANMFEAFGSGPGGTRSDRFDVTTSYHSSTVWTGIQVKF
ncbi:MAG: hypothetical protein KAJ37_12330 [Candidatus Krumholzibacteria bacterium]|nr:hypothetical protein [Candidatus Krumholzibacteria bacterium]